MTKVKKPKYVVIDIDGTIADISHRTHYIEGVKPDWDKFFSFDEMLEDKPILPIIDFLKKLSKLSDYRFVFCTGRPQKTREVTIRFLRSQFRRSSVIDKSDFLIMREDDDKREDNVVKLELLSKYVDFTNIAFVLEDRNSVVEIWRKYGLTCLQVSKGDF